MKKNNLYLQNLNPKIGSLNKFQRKMLFQAERKNYSQFELLYDQKKIIINYLINQRKLIKVEHIYNQQSNNIKYKIKNFTETKKLNKKNQQLWEKTNLDVIESLLREVRKNTSMMCKKKTSQTPQVDWESKKIVVMMKIIKMILRMLRRLKKHKNSKMKTKKLKKIINSLVESKVLELMKCLLQAVMKMKKKSLRCKKNQRSQKNLLNNRKNLRSLLKRKNLIQKKRFQPKRNQLLRSHKQAIKRKDLHRELVLQISKRLIQLDQQKSELEEKELLKKRKKLKKQKALSKLVQTKRKHNSENIVLRKHMFKTNIQFYNQKTQTLSGITYLYNIQLSP
ncbi:hypothetical protein TTHERM_001001221 (macronuclear) [Tetrahymena thermophila SB210]|uniref:Uncharacterized protein n=1 Tax=Tetrahymena thermophila (strain SB210) TaxID=312017 RepID=W7WZN4_TETTS|nr:hypothetical protein TTHERM_001001221 [Tetrahymena thermophila SB210]EWS71057.1 hypothetical protein TTHERM_001001221 [Tetrahymena thermophila SB210]|eukprot:XP_012656398.1 hypothetical protein TTHERM_001001221 [Tetrahymena thermophila SB210]